MVGTAGVDPKFILGVEIGDMAAYGMTKAAALVATVKFAINLASEGFTIVTISPGLVDTSGTVGDTRK